MNDTGVEAIERSAADWLLRQDEPGWNAAGQAALDAWLEASPAHRAAFYRLEYAWRQADRLAVLRPPAAGAALPAGAGRRRTRHWWKPAALAAVLALVAVGVANLRLPGVGPSAGQVYSTGVGGRQTVSLPDGTRMELNTDTRLRAAMGPAGRRVWLERGEAYFDVRRDPARPFVVFAGDRKVTVLGTRFSVRRTGAQLQVAVAEGRVQVGPVAPAPHVAVETARRGEIVVAQGNSTLVATASVERVDRSLSWRHGMLTFERVTLGQAAAEFNRYNRRKLVATGPAAGMRIAGSFAADNIDAFADLLQSAYGLRVETDGERLVISR